VLVVMYELRMEAKAGPLRSTALIGSLVFDRALMSVRIVVNMSGLCAKPFVHCFELLA
jgi:hypothetical protein